MTKSSLISGVFVLCATTLGAGVLALPFSFSLLGIYFGIFLLSVIGVLSVIVIDYLLESSEIVGVRGYGDLAEIIFPRYGRKAVAVMILVLIFGALSAFLVIIGDTLSHAVQALSGHSGFVTTRYFLTPLVMICTVFPLSLLRSVHQLERWSFLAVGIILVFCGVIFGIACDRLSHHRAANGQGVSELESWKFSLDFFQALPIISTAFGCQTMIFPLWAELEKPTLSRMKVLTRGSIFLSALAYLVCAIFGYISFGTAVDVCNIGFWIVFFALIRL